MSETKMSEAKMPVAARASQQGQAGRDSGNSQSSLSGRASQIKLALQFVEMLRKHGISVSPQSSIFFEDALEQMNRSDMNQLYWAGRITLISNPTDIAIYDQVFNHFWTQFFHSQEPSKPTQEQADEIQMAFDSDLPADDETPEEPATEEEPDIIAVRYSPQEILAKKDFADCSEQEIAELSHLFAQLRLSGPTTKSRRQRITAHNRGPLDIRRTIGSGLRTGGELLRWYHSQPKVRQRRLVLLIDVSGSMATYSRALLRFTHAAVGARRRTEVFAFATRLTRLTRELTTHDPDEALANAAEAVQDWSGGTRLGDTLQEFNFRWGIPGIARGAVVVILSDGWDRGDAEMITEQMARLQRASHKLIWVNPLKATPDYAPLARGMAAALPYVDEFLSGHSFEALTELAEAVCQEDSELSSAVTQKATA